MKSALRLIVYTAFALALAGVVVATPADPDLFGQFAAARHMVASGQITAPDSFSFLSDRPWINHEWLSELIFYVVYRVGGTLSLIALKVLLVALVAGLTWRHARRVGASQGVASLLAVLVVIGTYWRMHYVRPQLFSVLLFALVLAVIVEVDRGRWRALWVLPPLFALWVNLHGGWLVGAGTLALWGAFRIFDRQVTSAHRATLLGAGAVAALATLANPYGIGMWALLAGTVGLARPDIDDWSPLWIQPAAMWLPWLFCLRIVAVAWWRNRGAIPSAYVAIVFMLGAAALRISRLDAFFAVSSVMLFAPWAASVWRSTPAPTPKAVPSRATTAGVGLVVAALVVVAARVVAPYATCMPVGSAPEAEAAEFVERNRLAGRVVTFYNWGAYIAWWFTPSLEVSIDGRRETVYSDDVLRAHYRLYEAEPGYPDVLKRFEPDYIWLPKTMPVVDQLASVGWRRIFDGPESAIFTRDSRDFVVPPSPAPTMPARRCFPGP